MRVTIDLDDDLMAEAMEITGLSTVEATVGRISGYTDRDVRLRHCGGSAGKANSMDPRWLGQGRRLAGSDEGLESSPSSSSGLTRGSTITRGNGSSGQARG
ncbi:MULTISPECIES: type II toxin-antitoxin system VapB family antitoxin [Agrobacterium tumefaciens complex]|uniref:type II toxin-antitoxin system VapB family antitoxin n=1 Tax=Agrobacterium tumefaciens complex TaxID=1183400 RepID=UPI00293470BC|nr:type II toxin-antitoxin system VapB family antitoxin [Agrobacterium tumefaciens]